LDRSRNLETDENALNVLSSYNGVIVLPGFGARGAEGKIKAIKLARENNLSFIRYMLWPPAQRG